MALYHGVTSGLTQDLKQRCEAIFANFQIKDDADNKYQAGPIIKAAWEAEDAFSDRIVQDIRNVLLSLLERDSLAGHSTPTCCDYHSNKVFMEKFSEPSLYPPDNQLLATLTELVWCLLPHSRGIVNLNPASATKMVLASRFIKLDDFLDRHVLDFPNTNEDRDIVKDQYVRFFKPTVPTALRRAKLKQRIQNNELLGMVGARPEKNPAMPLEPKFCDQCRPFWTPSEEIAGNDKNQSPDRLFQKLGLHFSHGAQYAELIYEVEISPSSAAQRAGPSAPSVVDAGGYWLFRPDRESAVSDGLFWNHTRDVATNGRGCRELISQPLSVSMLTDLIVWPVPTSGDWTTGAAKPLCCELAI